MLQPRIPYHRMLLACLLLGALALISIVAAPRPIGAQGPAGQRLFGHDNGRSATIEIDTATGRARLVGATGFDSGSSGMATAFGTVLGPMGRRFAAGTFFGILGDNIDRNDYIVVVDPVSGRGEKLVQTSERFGGRGIAFGPDGTTLYAVNSTELVRVDTTDGTVTQVGDIQDTRGQTYSSDNLEWDPASGRFVSLLGGGVGRAQLALIEPSTAEATLISPIDVNSCTIVRAPNPVPGPGGVDWPTGTWFTIDQSTSELVTIEFDVAAGTARVGTRIGSLGGESSGSVCGTAFTLPQVPPTPTAGPTATPTSTAIPTASPTPVPAGPGCVCDLNSPQCTPGGHRLCPGQSRSRHGLESAAGPQQAGSAPVPGAGPRRAAQSAADVLGHSQSQRPLPSAVQRGDLACGLLLTHFQMAVRLSPLKGL